MPPSGNLEGDFSENEEYWIFGYGSLIWKSASFPIKLTAADHLHTLTDGSLGSSLPTSDGSGNLPLTTGEHQRLPVESSLLSLVINGVILTMNMIPLKTK
jgi:hypothetical protein